MKNNLLSQTLSKLNPDDKIIKENYASGFSAYHKISPYNYVTKLHYHDHFEIYYCYEGGESFIVEDKIYPLENRTMLIMNNYEIHKPISKLNTRYERYIIFIDPIYISKFIPRYYGLIYDFVCSKYRKRKIVLSDDEEREFLNLFKKITDLDENEIYSDLLSDVLYFQIIVYVMQLYSKKKKTSNESTYKPIDINIEKILHYINNNFKENISLEDISKYMHMNKNYLCSLFKKATNTTIFQHITNKRISHAKILLSQNYKVSEISEKCGFNEYSHFIRTFTKHTGYSPNKYRKTKYI